MKVHKLSEKGHLQINLSPKEAAHIMTVLGNIIGSGELRRDTNALYNAMYAVGTRILVGHVAQVMQVSNSTVAATEIGPF